MNARHERIEELLAVRSLGGLDGDDVEMLERELAGHGDCAECRRLEDGFAATAARLADTLDPEPVDHGMIEAILAATPRTVVSLPEAGDAEEPFARRQWSSWRTAVALAAAFVLIMIAGALGLRTGRTIPVRSAALDQRVVRFQGDAGSLTAAYTPGTSGVVLFGSGLPKAGEGEVYEVWTITGDQPTSAGCTLSAGGAIVKSLSTNITTVDVLAVTIERSSCPSAPTQTPILTATIA